MGILWPRSNEIVWTNAGVRAAGAKAYFYESGTTTPRSTFQDAALTTPHTVPVVADGYGRMPAIFLDFEDYRERVRTSGDTTLWDTDAIPNPVPFTADLNVDPDALLTTGDYIFCGKNGTRNGAVRCNGRTIGSATSGATERANPDTADLYAYLWDNYANGQCAVSTGRGASAAADFAANKTIGLPDHRSATIVGFDDMGNSAAGLAASAPVVSGSAILAGSTIGANTHTLLTAEAPAHTHSFSATTSSDNAHSHTFSGTSSTDGAHTHTGSTGDNNINHQHTYTIAATMVGTFTGGGSNGWGGSTTASTSTAGNNHQHAFTTDSGGSHSHTYSGTTSTASAHTHTVSGTSGSTGGGGAHNNLQRSIPVTVLMRL